MFQLKFLESCDRVYTNFFSHLFIVKLSSTANKARRRQMKRNIDLTKKNFVIRFMKFLKMSNRIFFFIFLIHCARLAGCSSHPPPPPRPFVQATTCRSSTTTLVLVPRREKFSTLQTFTIISTGLHSHHLVVHKTLFSM